MTSDIALKKKALRAIARKRRKALSRQIFPTAWAPATTDFSGFVRNGAIIASYRPIGSEADPAAAERWCQSHGAQICYPRIDDDEEMRFYAIGAGGRWEKAQSGFDEPSGDVVLATPSIVFLPLLAFDRTGTRLGQGGGHYDRALATLAATHAVNDCQPLKIGIAWSVQEMADLPREPWDIALNIVITEREWIVTS